MAYSASNPVPSLPWRFHTRTVDLDLASEQGAETYYPLRMTVLGRVEAFMMSINAMQLGPVLVGDCRFNADIRMDFGELREFYHVNIPLSGRLDSLNLRNEITATAKRAVVYGPTGDVRLSRWSAESRILCVKIRRVALENELERLLQRPVRRPLGLGPSIDLTSGYGRDLRDLACLLARQVAHAEPLVRQEIIGGQLWHSMLAHLLAAAEHPYRAELLDPRPPYRTPHVKKVVDKLRESPGNRYSAGDLAAIAGVAVRTLQDAFKSQLGMSPMEYLREVRLERAHADLLVADPASSTVDAVAHRWGFAHLGRFAADYGRRYGVPPSATLRSAG